MDEREAVERLRALFAAAGDQEVTADDVASWFSTSQGLGRGRWVDESAKALAAGVAEPSTQPEKAVTEATGALQSQQPERVGATKAEQSQRPKKVAEPTGARNFEVRPEAEKVFEHWRTTYDKGTRAITPQQAHRLHELLDYPFSAEQLCRVLDEVRDNPRLINRSQVRPNLTTVFRVPRHVCKILGVVFKPRGESWLERFDLVWQRGFGSPIPYGIAAKVLRPLVQKYGVEEVERRLDVYAQDADAKFATLYRFATMWNQLGNGSMGKGRRNAATFVKGL